MGKYQKIEESLFFNGNDLKFLFVFFSGEHGRLKTKSKPRVDPETGRRAASTRRQRRVECKWASSEDWQRPEKKTAATAEGLKGKGSPRLRREGVKVARPSS